MGVSFCSFCAEPWGESHCEPSWAHIFAIYPRGSCWLKLHWLSDLGVLGAHPSGESLKSWGTRCWVHPVHYSWRTRELWIPSQLYVAMPGVGLWWDCVSSSPTYFDVVFFSFALLCRWPSATFWISFRGNCFVYSCRNIVSMGGGKFRLLCCHLVLESLLYSYDIKSFSNISYCRVWGRDLTNFFPSNGYMWTHN